MIPINLYFEKLLAGIIAGLCSVFIQNLLPLFIVVAIFEGVDFITGVIKSKVIAKRRKEKFAFESVKAWRTIYKCVFILIGVVLAELLDHTLDMDSRLKFANYFTAFCCGIEF